METLIGFIIFVIAFLVYAMFWQKTIELENKAGAKYQMTDEEEFWVNRMHDK